MAAYMAAHRRGRGQSPGPRWKGDAHGEGELRRARQKPPKRGPGRTHRPRGGRTTDCFGRDIFLVCLGATKESNAMNAASQDKPVLTQSQIEKLHKRLLAERARLRGDDSTLSPARAPDDQA